MRELPESNRRSDHPEVTGLLAHPAHLVSHVKAMRADGDLRGAVALLREALHQDPGNSEIRGLLAQTQSDLRIRDEKRAWLALVAETRELVEEHIERGELVEAEAVLTDVRRRHGAIAELQGLVEQLQVLQRDQLLLELTSHLVEAERLRDEGYLQESVWEARQALALDPQNHQATTLANSLILEIEERDLDIAVRRDAARIAALLGRGRLLRAGLSIRNSRRKYGNLPALQGQLQRRRRLRTIRWAKRRVKVQGVGRALPVERLRSFPSSVFESTVQVVSRGWVRASHTAGAPARWIRLRLEERSQARTRKEQLVLLRRERESMEVSSHLREAERLRDEGQFQESLAEARQALALDPQDSKAASLGDSLVVEIEKRKRSAAAQLDATRIDALLERGRLLRAEMRIKRGLREYGSLPVLRDQLQRCRRLRTTRWAKRRTLASHTAGAPARWIRLRLEERSRARTRLRDARLREQEMARLELVAETRARVEEHVERGELAQARTALAEVESRRGVLEELGDCKQHLRVLLQDWESEKLATHLSEALGLRDEDRLEESVGEARQALALDPQNREAADLVDSLISEIDRRELESAARRDTARIGALLGRGRLLRSELAIRVGRRKYGDLATLQSHHRRCRRLWATRWTRRREKVREVSRAIPVERIKTFPSSASKTAIHLASRGWLHASGAGTAFVGWIRPQLDNWTMAKTRVLVASFSLVALAAAGISLVNSRGHRESDLSKRDQASVVDLESTGTITSSGDLILDALPWGRVVAIEDQGGEQQILEESLFTPVRRSLPAGSYRVVLENPAVEEPAEFWVQVFPSGVTTKVHEFEPFDADTYFGKAGWQESGP